MLDNDITPARVSLLDDCYNIFCTRLLHAPPAVVRTLQALSGMMHGDGKATFFHWQLSARLFPLQPIPDEEEFKRDKGNNIQTAGRWLDRTLEWMDSHNIPFEYEPGRRVKDKDKPIPSKVASPFFDLMANLANLASDNQPTNEKDKDRFTRYLTLCKAVISEFNEHRPDAEQIWIRARLKSKPPNKLEMRIDRNEKQVISRALKCSEGKANKEQVSRIEALAALLDETARKFESQHPEECDGMRIVVKVEYDEPEGMGVNFDYNEGMGVNFDYNGGMGVNFDHNRGMGVNFDYNEPEGVDVNFEDVSFNREQHFEDEGGAAGRGVMSRASLSGLEVAK